MGEGWNKWILQKFITVPLEKAQHSEGGGGGGVVSEEAIARFVRGNITLPTVMIEKKEEEEELNSQRGM